MVSTAFGVLIDVAARTGATVVTATGAFVETGVLAVTATGALVVGGVFVVAIAGAFVVVGVLVVGTVDDFLVIGVLAEVTADAGNVSLGAMVEGTVETSKIFELVPLRNGMVFSLLFNENTVKVSGRRLITGVDVTGPRADSVLMTRPLCESFIPLFKGLFERPP